LKINASDEKVFTTVCGLGDGGGGDSGRWLRRQAELELADEELEFGFGVGVAGKHDLAPIGCREMDIDHLDCSEFLDGAARGQPRARAWRRRVSVICRQ